MSKSAEVKVSNWKNEEFINCVVLPESHIMVATIFFINIFDQSLRRVNQIRCDRIYKGIGGVCHLSEALDKKEFLVALYPHGQPEYKHRYEGNGSNKSWVVKAEYNSNSHSLELKNPSDSLFIDK